MLYLNHGIDQIPDEERIFYFLQKHRAFTWENEFRVILVKSPHYDYEVQGCKVFENDILVRAKIAELIEKVYVTPASGPWFKTTVEETLRRFGCDAGVVQSQI